MKSLLRQFATACAVVTVAGFTSSVFAQAAPIQPVKQQAPACHVAPQPEKTVVYDGKIQSINSKQHRLTVVDGTLGKPVVVSWNAKTSILKDGQPATLADLKANENVTCACTSRRVATKIEINSMATKPAH